MVRDLRVYADALDAGVYHYRVSCGVVGFLFAFFSRGVADARFGAANWCFACRVVLWGFYSRSS